MAYRTLDDRDVRDQALADPEGLLDDLGQEGAVIDEVQRAPNLLLALKSTVDREQKLGRYLLSGSNQPKVAHALADSLLGRTGYRTLRPLTLGEQRYDEKHRGWEFLFGPDDKLVLDSLIERATTSGELDWHEIARTGGFPRALAAPPNQRLRILDDYIQTFAHRDIREVVGIESVDRFETFLRLIATRTAQELNASNLSSDLGTPVATIRRWVDALVRSYLVEVIPAYHRNAGRRVIKAPKIYMVDTALALAASRAQEPTGGFYLETAVAGDLCVWRDEAPEQRALHHWRVPNGPEVDFVLGQGKLLLPVEIKTSGSVDSSDAHHLRRFRTDNSNAPRAVLLSCDPYIRVLTDGIIAAPWWAVI